MLHYTEIIGAPDVTAAMLALAIKNEFRIFQQTFPEAEDLKFVVSSDRLVVCYPLAQSISGKQITLDELVQLLTEKQAL